MASIFDKQRELRPSRMAAVAERRFADAEALCATKQNERSVGAQYLAGLVLDILLKAQLVRRFPNTAKKGAHETMAAAEREIWSLIWRSHDLDEMLASLPEVQAAIDKKGERAGRPYLDWLKGICAVWTVFARYSSVSSTAAEANELLERVRELKEVLK